MAACGAPAAVDTGESDCAIRGAGIGVGPTTRADARGNRESTSAARGVIAEILASVVALELADALIEASESEVRKCMLQELDQFVRPASVPPLEAEHDLVAPATGEMRECREVVGIDRHASTPPTAALHAADFLE